jgi:hypothetical protein
VLISICFATVGCTLFKSKAGTEVKKNESTIWSSREQNVRIVRQDLAQGAVATPNDHPIMLVAEQVRSGLRTLEVKLTAKEKTVPVFTEPELDTLGTRLCEALAQAGPDKDVTFVVIGQRKALYGLAKQRKVTTGRVFYREGKLNIIFGKIIDDIRENIDLRVYPLTPGMRSKAVSHEWILEETPDMQFYAGADALRNDWVVLDLASIAAYEALGIKPAKGARKAAKEVSGVESAESAPQYSRPEGTASAPVQALPAVKAEKPTEERLRILNDLKAKKLITDEEYKAKRANILNDL